MNLQAIHHVALWVSDAEQSKAFYIRKLGFALLRETVRPERGDSKLDLRLGDVELELFCATGHPKRPSYPEALGLRHLAFRVEDVANAVEELAKMGVDCEPIRLDACTGKRMTFFFDPDGQPLEFHE